MPWASLLHIRFNIQPVDDSPPLQSNPVVVLEHLMKLLESILQVRDQPWALVTSAAYILDCRRRAAACALCNYIGTNGTSLRPASVCSPLVSCHL
jgi:hypothetical protein